MCGIIGILRHARRGARSSRELVSRMNESQHHRGPDEGGLHIEPGVGLGHRRLSIIDLVDRPAAAVQRGRQRRHRLQRRDLQLPGADPRADGARPRLPHAQRHRGHRPRVGGVGRGAASSASAACSRSRCGTATADAVPRARPARASSRCYYALLPDGMFVFGSELKSLLAHGGLRARHRSLRGRGVFRARLRPRAAHDLQRRAQAAAGAHADRAPRRGRCPSRASTGTRASRSTARSRSPTRRAELAARLDESVRLRMISEVPLGAFLSGGVDSSAVVATMARLSPTPVNTCSIAFADPAFDESRYAQQVAERYRHAPLRRSRRERRLRPDRHARARLRRAVRRQLGDSDLPRLPARAHARDGRAVGRRRRRELRRLSPLPPASRGGADARAAPAVGLRRPLFGLLGHAYPKADWAPRVFRAKSTFEALARDSVEAYFHGVSILRDGMRARLFTRRVPARARRLQRGRGVPPPRAQGRHRRSAGAGPVPRPQDLSGRRHQHQGRPREHGALARGARAADGPPAGRVAGDAAVVAEDARRRRQVAAQEGDGAAAAARGPVPAEDGLRGAARALVPRPAARARARRACWASASPTPAIFDRDYLRRLVDAAPVAARATTARRCGRC